MYPKYAKLRDAKGYNDLTVAKETGIPATTIYDWKRRTENHKDKPTYLSAEYLQRIAKLFKVKIEDLI